MKCQILFSGKNKKNIISLSSAENAQRVVKVKRNLDINQPSGIRFEHFCPTGCLKGNESFHLCVKYPVHLGSDKG